MPDDEQASYVAMSSVAMIFIMLEREALVFYKEGFQIPISSLFEKMTKKAKTRVSAQQGNALCFYNTCGFCTSF